MPVPAQHAHLGAREPMPLTIGRVPGSHRRTTTVDMLWPDGLAGDLVLRGSGRDARTAADGAVEPLDEAQLHVEIDFGGGRAVRSIRSDPAEPGLMALVGTSAAAGFRRAAAAAAPRHVAARDVLYQLLDDVPVASLIVGYGALALDRRDALGPAGLVNRADICAGFQSGGTMMRLIAQRGDVPAAIGPDAPDVVRDDRDGWHNLPTLELTAMRRRRLLDVSPGDGDRFRVFSWFRDTFRHPDGVETIVHEYQVDAQVEPGSWRLVDVAATPHVLPWAECIQAAGSAERLVGATLPELRASVRSDFTGTTTCTHLNDQLRSLTDVIPLAEACARQR
jgi:hypothetical protein